MATYSIREEKGEGRELGGREGPFRDGYGSVHLNMQCYTKASRRDCIKVSMQLIHGFPSLAREEEGEEKVHMLPHPLFQWVLTQCFTQRYARL